MNVYIFLGPSLAVNEAKKIIDAHYLPPVAMGDVLRVLSRKPKAIAIIDGFFDAVPAVWHKEILFALSQGVAVYGSSSMGALRAAELHTFGMRGVGRIFESYRDGVLDADDEVAVAHGGAESGYIQLSDPLVNIRQGLESALEASVISPCTVSRLLRVAKGQFYPNRSWKLLLENAMDVGVSESEVQALRRYMPTAPNLKKKDAVALLELIQEELQDGVPSHAPTFTFEQTYYWHAFVAYEGAIDTSHETELVSSRVFGKYMRLKHPRHRQMLVMALFSFLLVHEAKRCALLPPDLQARAEAWLEGTCRATPGDMDEFEPLISALIEEFVVTFNSRLDVFVAAELSRTGMLAKVADSLRHRATILRKGGIHQPQLSDTGIDLQALSDWYEQNFGLVKTSGDEHARSLGFATWEDFISEVITEFVVTTRA